ncbi:2-hydroxyacylsphingosine 1-beta-galactosyltransferase-like isoform X2 [Littorina saxatilis]
MGLLLLTLFLPLLFPGSDVTCDAKRVVSLSSPFTSHTNYHTNVARALVKLGHQVWLTMPDYLADKGVLDTSNVSVIEYTLSKNYQETTMALMRDKYFVGLPDDFVTMASVMKALCHEMISNLSFVEEIRKVKPDLIVIDNIPIVRMLTVIAYKLGVPFAYVGTVYDADTMRIPYSPAVTPQPLFVISDVMTFFQRVGMFCLHIIAQFYDPFLTRNMVAIYAPERPFISNDMLLAGAEIWLVEMDHILDYPRPTLPNVKLIGGTATGPTKPLPPHFASFMDGATEGVVIVSFGSYVLGVPADISHKLTKVFQQLPFKVVFRSNLTSPDPSKIMTSRWLPQNDLLGHPNTRVFVSHCGKNGQYEALYHAVPMLCTPMFGDQPYNAERIRIKGYGEVLDLRTFSQKEMFNTIFKIAQDSQYKQSIAKASTLFRSQYGVPMHEAAKWLAHVMQYGGEYMRSQGQRIPRYQFMMLDVMAFVFVVGAVTSLMLYFCVRKLCSCTKRKQKNE